MSFSDKIYITNVKRGEPEDKAEWVAKIARILLWDCKKQPRCMNTKKEEVRGRLD